MIFEIICDVCAMSSISCLQFHTLKSVVAIQTFIALGNLKLQFYSPRTVFYSSFFFHFANCNC